MSEHVLAQTQQAKTSQSAAKESAFLQHREWEQAEQSALQHWQINTIASIFSVPRVGYDFSHVLSHTGMVRQNQPMLRTQPMVQRSPRNQAEGSAPCATCSDEESTPISALAEPTPEATSPAPESTQTPTTAEPETESAAPEKTTAPVLLLEDSATELASEQMRKSEFLAQLRTEVNRAAEAAMAGTGRTTADCPYLNYWFGYYSLRDSAHIERAIHRYSSETANANTASEYIPIIAGRVHRAIETWARTGEITGVPEGIPTSLPGTSPAGGEGGAEASTRTVMFKAREGGARAADDPQTIQRALGEGRPLESTVRSRMESAFGIDFSHVRAHMDDTAAGLSNRFNARAFTVGNQVAFGANEYKPGTLIGDALIAHELAHVVQQQGSTGSTYKSMPIGPDGQRSLEEDSDKSAAGVVTVLWGQSKGRLAHRGQQIIPRFKSGLQLQRCASRLPALRDPQVIHSESQAFSQQVSTTLSQRAAELTRETQDQARQMDITTAEVEIGADVQGALTELWQIFQDELQDAGSDTEAQARAQQRYEQEIQRIRDSYVRQFEMTVRWGIPFTTAATTVEARVQPLRIRRRRRHWSLEELNTINSILEQIPVQYMANMKNRIQKIQREIGESGSSAADWEESTGTLRVYDPTFERPENLREYILHEIGHSTVQERTVGNFHHLPPTDWMELSDWDTTTRTALGTDLGIQGATLQQTIVALDERKERQTGIPRPLLVRDRYVIFDKYEPRDPFPPEQFVHYSARHDQPPDNEEFVSNYARTHPAEDLAESFAFYLINREATQRKLDSSVPRITSNTTFRNKWHYLVTNYPHQLIQRKSKVDESKDPLEREANQIADKVVHLSIPNTVNSRQYGLRVQCQHTTSNATEEPLSSGVVSQPKIVEDDTSDLLPGQLRKREFLNQLRTEVCRTVETAIAETGQTTDGCPYIGRWFDFYSRQDSAHIERAIHMYAPEASHATTAREYISAVTQRARQSAETWARTGEITGLPEGMAPGLLGMGLSGIAGGLLSGFASFGASLVQGPGQLFSGISGIFFKSRNSNTEEVDNPDVIQTELGEGQSLDSGIRSRMESAFGMDFSHVRIHTDSSAAILSDRFNARAFTLGKHIAFASGEYKPYTPVGDALIAHEMAHVVQQGAATSSSTPMAKGAVRENSLEEEADLSAINIVTSFWGKMKGRVSDIDTNFLPRLRSGLRLQRCGARHPQSRNLRSLPRSEEVADLPRQVVESLRPSISSSNSGVRQAALDELNAWARQETSLGIDWNRVSAVHYGVATYGECVDRQEGQLGEERRGREGSCTDASDPMNMIIWIGPAAFSSVSNLYSTFRHELVHVQQHHDHQRAISQGRGIKEVYAYLWELENAGNTGLARRENWGLRPDGRVDKSVGLARVVDGLLRSMVTMADELHRNPNLIPEDEVQALQTRIACALLSVPQELQRGFRDDINWAELRSACDRSRSR